MGVNDYIVKNLRDYNLGKNNDSWIGIAAAMGHDPRPVDGVAMAKARNKARRLLKKGVHPDDISNYLRPSEGFDMSSDAPKGSISKLGVEDEAKIAEMSKDLVDTIGLPPHLFELKGKPMLKKEASADMVETYLRDLEKY